MFISLLHNAIGLYHYYTAQYVYRIITRRSIFFYRIIKRRNMFIRLLYGAILVFFFLFFVYQIFCWLICWLYAAYIYTTK